ncbi:hypothetical protein ACTHGU_08120 [Chitinophagaceae bacterium MMS25-I14]
MNKNTWNILLFILNLLVFGSCNKHNNGDMYPSHNTMVRKITFTDDEGTYILLLSYNADNSLARIEIINDGHTVNTILYTYTPQYHLIIKDYGGAYSEKDSVILDGNNKAAVIWHKGETEKNYGSSTAYMYNNDGTLAETIDMRPGAANIITSYTWTNGNMTSKSSNNTSSSYTYDLNKLYQPGDHTYLDALTNLGDLQLNNKNKNLITGSFTYTWDSDGRITHCIEPDAIWSMEY